MHLQIDAMHCGGCAKRVTTAIHSVDPLAKIDVDLPMKPVTIVSDTDEDVIAAGLKVAGYPARRSTKPRSATT